MLLNFFKSEPLATVISKHSAAVLLPPLLLLLLLRVDSGAAPGTACFTMGSTAKEARRQLMLRTT
jgi:hypothetical protein